MSLRLPPCLAQAADALSQRDVGDPEHAGDFGPAEPGTDQQGDRSYRGRQGIDEAPWKLSFGRQRCFDSGFDSEIGVSASAAARGAGNKQRTALEDSGRPGEKLSTVDIAALFERGKECVLHEIVGFIGGTRPAARHPAKLPQAER